MQEYSTDTFSVSLLQLGSTANENGTPVWGAEIEITQGNHRIIIDYDFSTVISQEQYPVVCERIFHFYIMICHNDDVLQGMFIFLDTTVTMENIYTVDDQWPFDFICYFGMSPTTVVMLSEHEFNLQYFIEN